MPVAKRFRRVVALCLVATFSQLAGCVAVPHQESAGEFVDDTLLTARVKAALVAEPGIRANEISVQTFRGRVQLSGFVSSHEAIERAVEIARSTPGVASVANDMRLR